LESADDSTAQASLEKVRRLCKEKDFDMTAETFRELTEITREGLERTARLVGDLRVFSGPAAARAETLDVRAGLESTVHLMGYSLRESGIDVEIEATQDLPLLVGDPRALNQVFLNLLKNARDAMNGRKGKIHVNLFADDKALTVRIRDEGPGIPAKIRDTLFEPFCTTKGPGEGSGLGLSISRNILYSQHGSLSLLETSEKGTTFEVRLMLPDDD
jgi:C4-dicarboxylate-specific signal transduction histidine kinase